MSRKHAILSASGAHRWLNCTPSAMLEEQFSDTESSYALEGTIAHKVAEAKAISTFINSDRNKAQEWYSKQIDQIKARKDYQEFEEEDPHFFKEIDRYTDTYISHLKSINEDLGGNTYTSTEEKVSFGDFVPNGFGTADCIMIKGEHLHVVDFKYGIGVVVDVENNPQLMLYGLGALLKYRIFYDIKTIHLHVVQPRARGSEPINCWVLTSEELMDWAESIKPVANKAHEGEGEQIPGDWCRFCRAKAVCKARAEENIKLAGFTKVEAKTLTNDQIGEYLKIGEDVASWLKDLQEYALSESLAGREIKGYKAVEGRSSRNWIDQLKAFAVLEKEAGLTDADLYDRVPLSVAKVEKIVGKKEFKELEPELVNKKPGKPTLVKASDRREAITNKKDLEEIFN